MEVKLILNDGIRLSRNFVEVKDGVNTHYYFLKHIQVSGYFNEPLYVSLDTLQTRIPEGVAPYIDGVIFGTVFPNVPKRVIGIYKDFNLDATLDDHGASNYRLSI